MIFDSIKRAEFGKMTSKFISTLSGKGLESQFTEFQNSFSDLLLAMDSKLERMDSANIDFRSESEKVLRQLTNSVTRELEKTQQLEMSVESKLSQIGKTEHDFRQSIQELKDFIAEFPSKFDRLSSQYKKTVQNMRLTLIIGVTALLMSLISLYISIVR